MHVSLYFSRQKVYNTPMNKILTAVLATALLTGTAQAQHRHYDNFGRDLAIAGGAIAVGTIFGVLLAPRYEYVPVCRTFFGGLDYYGRPVYVRECR